MDCPSCSNTASLASVQAHNGYKCSDCDGLWVPEPLLESLCQLHNFDLSVFIEQLRKGGQNDSALECPSCRSMLSTSMIGQVEIDRCDSCGSIWFDRGEVEKLASGSGEILRPAGAKEVVLAVGSLLFAMLP